MNISGEKKNLCFSKIEILQECTINWIQPAYFSKLSFFNSNTLLSMQICTISFRTLCKAILQRSSQESCIKGKKVILSWWLERWKKRNINYKQWTPLTRMDSVWLIEARHPAIEKWEHKKNKMEKTKTEQMTFSW